MNLYKTLLTFIIAALLGCADAKTSLPVPVPAKSKVVLPPQDQSKTVKPSPNQQRVKSLNDSTLGQWVKPIATSKIPSQLAGWSADMQLSSYAIPRFLKEYPSIRANAEHFDNPKGNIEGYRTFNEFFTRRLSDIGKKARPFDMSEKVVASPADSSLFVIPRLKPDSEIFVKGIKFDLAKFLGSDALAKQYLGGTLLLFYLAPDDYHRFHAPFDAHITAQPKRIAGVLASVDPVGYSSKEQPLLTNERQLLMLKSTIFGEVAFVAIGAMMVGKIGWTFTGTNLIKGQDLGFFAFGGSTLVLIFKPGQIEVRPEFIKDVSDKSLDEMFKKGQIYLPVTKVRLGEGVADKI